MMVVAMRNGENADDKSWSGITTPINVATQKRNLEVHHILPRHEGGADNPENLITWCDDCHIQLDAHRAKFASKSKNRPPMESPLRLTAHGGFGERDEETRSL